MSGEELAVIEGQVVEALAVRRPPEVVLEEARKAAVALTTVLNAKPRKVMFNGEQYLEFEDWQTVGRFYGITAKIESTAFVEYGTVRGFSARAVAIRADGMEISAAEAECLNDEEKWRSKTKYEWQDKPGGGREKVKIGEEPVPLFQLKSMAQTRASSKVLRNVLAWVVVLAGYRPTPAEELDAVSTDGTPATKTAPPAAQSTTTTAPPAGTKAAAPSVAGAEYVKSVTTPATEGKPSKIVMEDGRSGTTFDKKLIEVATEAHKGHLPCHAVFTNSDKVGRDNKPYVNLTGFTLAGQAPPATDVAQPQLPIPVDDGEPKGEPETILSQRAMKQSGTNTPYWVIQTDRRQYVTWKEGTALHAEALRKEKKQAIIIAETKRRPAGDGFYNEILQFTEVGVPPVEDEPAQEAIEAPL